MNAVHILLAGILCCSTSVFASDAKPKRDEIRLNYVYIEKLMEQLKGTFPNIEDIVTGFSPAKSVLTLDPNHPQVEGVRKKILELDVRPTQVILQTQVTEITKATRYRPERKEVIAKPTVVTLVDQPSQLRFKTPDGKEYVIDFTATVVPGTR